ncbi:oligopeptide transporter 4 [Atractiella rhizophila]|nr:oligopeptide transporter 4 [Atractiella rhizophila]
MSRGRYSNIWQTGYLPLNDNHLWDRNGHRYNVSRILTSEHTLDKEAYNNYSPAYWGAANALLYGFFFAFYTAGLVHAALYHYKPIIDGFRAMKEWKNAQTGYNDLHNRLMRNYAEVPEWWFGCIMVVSLTCGIVMVEIYDTQFPIWGFVICIALAFIFVVPAGMITAVGNVQITLNVIAELIGGYALPGKPLANMLFKSYGLLVTSQAITYASDLKLGHYLKLSPRLQFWAQTIATVWAAFVSLGVINWQILHIDNLCTPNQSAHFTCPGYNTFFSAAVVWGVIGPAKMYSQGGQIYHVCTYGFLIGAVAPIPFWFLARRYPRSWFKYVHVPAFFNGGLGWAPYNLSHLAFPGLWFAIFFQYFVRKRYLAWWSKYNYVLATALTASVAIFGVIWFFSLQFVDHQPVWWGNTVWEGEIFTIWVPFNLNSMADNCDGRKCPRLELPPDGFGPVRFLFLSPPKGNY